MPPLSHRVQGAIAVRLLSKKLPAELREAIYDLALQATTKLSYTASARSTAPIDVDSTALVALLCNERCGLEIACRRLSFLRFKASIDLRAMTMFGDYFQQLSFVKFITLDLHNNKEWLFAQDVTCVTGLALLYGIRIELDFDGSPHTMHYALKVQDDIIFGLLNDASLPLLKSAFIRNPGLRKQAREIGKAMEYRLACWTRNMRPPLCSPEERKVLDRHQALFDVNVEIQSAFRQRRGY